MSVTILARLDEVSARVQSLETNLEQVAAQANIQITDADVQQHLANQQQQQQKEEEKK